jgi:hypothetical protein
MDRTLEWLYAYLLAPLDAHLKARGVKYLYGLGTLHDAEKDMMDIPRRCGLVKGIRPAWCDSESKLLSHGSQQCIGSADASISF